MTYLLDRELFEDELELEDELEWFSSELEPELNRRSREYIKWVQRSLNRIINAGLVIDGILGSHTRRAIRSFQRRARIAVDGIVGAQTERALIKAGANAPPRSSTQPPIPTPSKTGSLSSSALAQAVVQNRQLAKSLGWDVLYDAIAGWILHFRTMTPTLETFTKAIAKWQWTQGLPANGILDYGTWQQMLAEAKAGIPRSYQTPEGVSRPHGLRNIVATFGDPTQRGWENRNIIRIQAPSGRQFRRGVTSHRVHRLLAPQFDRVFQAVHQQGMWNELVPTSGTYYCRTKSGYGKKPCSSPGISFNQLSTHSWGITIDIRATDYPYYKPHMQRAGVRLKYPPSTLAQIFQAYGFHWGLWFMRGTLDGRGRIDFTHADPMHFQFATGY